MKLTKDKASTVKWNIDTDIKNGRYNHEIYIKNSLRHISICLAYKDKPGADGVTLKPEHVVKLKKYGYMNK